MSDYVPIGGGGYYGGSSSQRNNPAKSVYYPPQQQASQQQLNQCPQGNTQLPPGAVPVVNMIETPPGVKLVSFQQDVTASIPPELQQQLQQFQQQQAQQAVPQQQQKNNAPSFVSSDYAQAGWESAYRATPIRIINQPPQQQQQQPAQGAQSNAALEAARSEYEQAMAQVQRAAERLGQLSGGVPQMQFSNFSQASGQQGFGGGAAQPQQFGGGQPQQQFQQGFGGGAAQPQQFQAQQKQFGSGQPQQQKQFGAAGGAQRQRLTPNNSSYRFEENAPRAAGRSFNQPQAESVYIGMPNNLYLASNRPRDYHFVPQRQESQTNLLKTARENPSGTNLRAARSEENVRTAILNEDGKVVGVVETHFVPAQQQAQGQRQQQQPGQGQQLQAGSSDYHFESLRGLNSAY